MRYLSFSYLIALSVAGCGRAPGDAAGHEADAEVAPAIAPSLQPVPDASSSGTGSDAVATGAAEAALPPDVTTEFIGPKAWQEVGDKVAESEAKHLHDQTQVWLFDALVAHPTYQLVAHSVMKSAGFGAPWANAVLETSLGLRELRCGGSCAPLRLIAHITTSMRCTHHWYGWRCEAETQAACAGDGSAGSEWDLSRMATELQSVPWQEALAKLSGTMLETAL